jgi:xanthine dehydrogenase YagS FAD-binding subunit
MAYKAEVHIINAEGKKKVVSMDDFFVRANDDTSTENILSSKEIITEITLPSPSPITKSYYIKHVARESYDWSLGDVAIVAEVDGKTIRSASIVLGAAAPTPYRAENAEKALVGKSISEENALNAAEIAMSRARPLSQNSYKIPLFHSLIKNAVLNLS